MVLPFNKEDDQGRWICKLAPHLYLVFKKDGSGKTQEMVLHQVARAAQENAGGSGRPGHPRRTGPVYRQVFFCGRE